MRTKLISLAVGALVCACATSASALAKKPSSPTYYLALGDSLARGVQPNSAGTSVPTNHGYVDDLYAREHAHEKRLKLAKLGCPGETTATMLNGGICHYAAGSQLKAALKFIKSHTIRLITLDIGANDVDGCAKPTGVDFTCIASGVASINANVPQIVRAVRKAAGKRVEIVAMTYYDPFLADYLQGASGQSLAQLSTTLSTNVNNDLVSAFKAQQVKLADVATAFDTYTPFSTTASLPGQGTVPLAVAQICTLTWMCAGAPQGPNIHANTAGYAAIAKVFERAI
jgi:lysophospholipase L1-like esterase